MVLRPGLPDLRLTVHVEPGKQSEIPVFQPAGIVCVTMSIDFAASSILHCVSRALNRFPGDTESIPKLDLASTEWHSDIL